MNKFQFLGRLTKEPEVKYTTNTNTQVTVIDLAVNRRYNNEKIKADFFHITSFGKTAEFIAQYFKKGRQVLIEGRIQNRTWDDTTGVKRYATDFIAEHAYFADSQKRDQDNNQGNYQAGEYITVDDEDLPF